MNMKQAEITAKKTNGVNVSLKTNTITKIAILSVIAYVLMLLEIPVFFFPGFLKMDLSDLPALIGAFALGPMVGVIIELVKNILHWMTASQTGGVGEIANFIVGTAWILPAAFTYKKLKTKKSAVLGMVIGVIVMAGIAALCNYYFLIPFYANFMPIEAIIEMSAAANAMITNMKTLILYGIIPFNLFKGAIITIITMLIYKKISPILHK